MNGFGEDDVDAVDVDDDGDDGTEVLRVGLDSFVLTAIEMEASEALMEEED